MGKIQWTEAEKQYLISNKDRSCKEIAVELGRTLRATRHMFAALGLKKSQMQIGEKINQLTLLSTYVDQNKHNKTYGVFQCECGKSTTALLSLVFKGKTKSCGCLRDKLARERTIKRNETYSKLERVVISDKSYSIKQLNPRLYRIHQGMKTRCNNPNSIGYKHYGGKGVKVCDDWMDYNLFYKWAILNGYEDTLTLDRIDTNKGYFPDNCRWTTVSEQNINKSSNFYITAFGETKALSEWSKDPRCKVSAWSLKYRIHKGWLPEKAIEYSKVNRIKSYKDNSFKTMTAFGETKTLLEWSEDPRCVVNLSSLYNRYKHHWNHEKALTKPNKFQKISEYDLLSLTAWGETKTVNQWLLDNRCKNNLTNLLNNIRMGLSAEEVIGQSHESILTSELNQL